MPSRPDLECWVWVSGLRSYSWFRVEGALGFRVYGLYFMVYGLRFMVYGEGFMVYGLWFMVQG